MENSPNCANSEFQETFSLSLLSLSLQLPTVCCRSPSVAIGPYQSVAAIAVTGKSFSSVCYISLFSAQEYDKNNAKLELREEITPASLTVQCLRSLVVNMGKINPSQLRYLPNHYREQFRPKSFTEVLFHLWPRNIRGDSIVLAVKKGMIISEVLFLLEGKLKLERELEVQLFKSCVPLEHDDFLQTDLGSYDCVFSSCKPLINVPPSTSAKDVCIYHNIDCGLSLITAKNKGAGKIHASCESQCVTCPPSLVRRVHFACSPFFFG